MARFVARKLLHIVAVLLLVSVVLAFLLDLAPGDPAYAILGEQATPEQVAQVHEELHLDDPLFSRYWRWVSNLAEGDLGQSYTTKEDVTDQILERLPVTLELAVLALLMALAISIPIGVYTAYRADGRFDRAWQVITSFMISVPSFVTALVLVLLLSVQLENFPIHFPVTGWTKLTDDLADNLWYAFLPAFTIALLEIPTYTRLLRADMIQTLQEDFVLAARAKGVPTRRILLRHALRPSSFSLLTLAGLSFGRTIGGAVIVETIFALPGIGQLLVQSILNKDVLMVQGVVMFIAVMYVVVNTGVDILYRYLDPRVRVRTA